MSVNGMAPIAEVASAIDSSSEHSAQEGSAQEGPAANAVAAKAAAAKAVAAKAVAGKTVQAGKRPGATKGAGAESLRQQQSGRVAQPNRALQAATRSKTTLPKANRAEVDERAIWILYKPQHPV